MSAATRLRRLDEAAEIVVLERTSYVSFANCGLPYHVGGVIEDRASLLLQTPESLAARFRLDVRVSTEAVSIDPDRHTVAVRNVVTGETSEITYDRLILAPGAAPVRPPIPGIDTAYALRNVEDMDALAAKVATSGSAAVIGGGFIGLEIAENLRHRGLHVTVLEAAPQAMAPLDPELAELVHRRLRDNGIDLRLGVAVAEVSPTGVRLADGGEIHADLVLAAIGVRPDSGLAETAGLTLGRGGAILVDDFGRTSAPDVYAVGDAVAKRDALDGSEVLVPLANTANLQGRRVADHIAGAALPFRRISGTAIVGVFGLQAAVTGWNEKRLVAAGRPHRIIHTHPTNHAGYYPGASGLAIKLLVDPETDAILGAQAVGEEGADKRIDVIATAMAGGITASGLADLELAYAPQFGSAKDPVTMLGFVAQNLREGLMESIQWHELEGALAAGASLIDVRSAGEFADGAIPGAINIPVDELRDRLSELPDGDLIVHCAVGVRGHTASRILHAAGRRSLNLDGGYRTWEAATA